MPVHNVVGSIVRDSDFFDRKVELARLRTDAMSDHVLILAPRRVGKTSLLYRFGDEVEREEGFHAVYVSVQGAPDELGVLRSLYESCVAHPAAKRLLAGRVTRRLKALARRVREIDLAGFGMKLDDTDPAQWQERARELAQGLEQLQGHWFFLMDEVPVLVLRLLREDPTGARARAFLEWFRSLRQQPIRDVVTRHWILAGSVGLDTVAHRHRLTDTINDLRPVRLGAFDGETALAFLHALGEGEGVPLGDAVARRAVERAGWPIPYHLHILFAALKDRFDETAEALLPADVDRAVDSLLRQHSYFDTWHERLTEELGEPADAWARALLSACARESTGASRSTLAALLAERVHAEHDRERELRFLLDVLVQDGYLHEQDDRFAFRSNLLREHWQRRYR